MKVIAQTAALQEAMNLTGSIVATRTPKPVLQCVKLIAAGDTLTMLATDLEVGCRYQLTAVQVEQEGEALMPADRLAGIVRESGDEESLTIDGEGGLARPRQRQPLQGLRIRPRRVPRRGRVPRAGRLPDSRRRACRDDLANALRDGQGP